MKAEIIRGNRG